MYWAVHASISLQFCQVRHNLGVDAAVNGQKIAPDLLDRLACLLAQQSHKVQLREGQGDVDANKFGTLQLAPLLVQNSK